VPGSTSGYQTIDNPDKIQVIQYSTEIQRQLSSTTVVKVGYRGSRGAHQARLTNFNSALPTRIVDGVPFFSLTPVVRNPFFGGIQLITTDAETFYNGLLVELSKRFSGGVQFQTSYTFSKVVTDASAVRNDGAGGGAKSYDFRLLDRGLSNFDVRHNAVFNVTAELPFGEGKHFPLSGWANALLGGWQVSGIVSLMSGNPVTITQGTTTATSLFPIQRRPDLVPGGDNNPVLGGSDQYFDPSQFSPAPADRVGTLGAMTLTGPGFSTVDFSVIKNFRVRAVSDDFQMSVRGEFFNLFNRANFGQPAAQVFNGQGQPVAGVGRITETATSARQVQLGLRLTW
jgi:hypothetical protein